jgi:hypothetical protein
MKIFLKMNAYVDVPKELQGESMEYIMNVLAPRMDLGDFYNVTAEPIAIIEEEEDHEP